MTDTALMTQTQQTVFACAKINLTLDVFSKRADGYHSLASVMQTIALYDTIHLIRQAEPGIVFTCDAPEAAAIPTDSTNLVVRAAQAALDDADAAQTGIQIHLVKHIPSQAGLGGGSSDAAATLLGVNALLNLQLDTKQLHTLAAGLGSDVPFFLLGGTATARGRGEQLSALPDAPPFWLVVVKPEENISTGWAYGALDAVPDRQSNRMTKRLEQAVQEGDRDLLIARQSNDFELSAFAHFPTLAWLHDELRMAGAHTAHLCGSGAALYGVTATEAEAQRIARMLTPRYPHVYVARTLSRTESNPLKERDYE